MYYYNIEHKMCKEIKKKKKSMKKEIWGINWIRTRGGPERVRLRRKSPNPHAKWLVLCCRNSEAH